MYISNNKTRKVVCVMIQHITESRAISYFSSLQDILPENPARFIDAFVESISLQTLGFSVQTIKRKGRLSFDTKIFLKIYLYGYLNGLRSPRKLEKALAISELQWLLYHTQLPSISDFRKQRPSGLKNLFKLFVSFLKILTSLDVKSSLIGKSRADSSKKHFNQKKIWT
jgi:transposase